MDDNMLNRLKMFDGVNVLMTLQNLLWSGILSIVDIMDDFTANLAAIALKNAKIAEDITGVTEAKKQAKLLMAKKAFKIAEKAYVCAKHLEKTKLTPIFNTEEYKIARASEQKALDLSKAILNNLPEIKDVLIQRHGITQERIDDFAASIALFESLKGTTRQEISMKAALGKTADQLVDDTMELLKDELDREMADFEESQPEFYEAYKHARKVINYGHRFETPVEPEPAPPQP